jgi:hypothetical protein
MTPQEAVTLYRHLLSQIKSPSDTDKRFVSDVVFAEFARKNEPESDGYDL